MGDVVKVVEAVEFACGIPHIMKGDAVMNISAGYDTTRYNEPLGVFAGIAPWNFPAMIPQGWMAPICIVTGNTYGAQGRELCAAMRDAHHRAVGGGGAAHGVLNMVTRAGKRPRSSSGIPAIEGSASSARPRSACTSMGPRRRTASACRR